MTVRIFSARTDMDEMTLSEFWDLLSRDEKSRAERFRIADVSRRFIASHGYLRCILSDETGIEPQRIVFTSLPGGKPEISGVQNARNTRFSLSHSHDVVVVAVCDGNRVGVDVEKMDGVRSIRELAARYFSGAEVRFLYGLNEPDQVETFFRLWTLKESWLKATGRGLADLHRAQTVRVGGDGEPGAGWIIDADAVPEGERPSESRHFEPFSGYVACYTRLYSSQTVSMM